MIKKEFYKFKEIYFVFIFLMGCFILYNLFVIKNFISNDGGVSLNLSFLYTKSFSFFHIDTLNIVFALIIGILVFIKERINARLRLSLNFPNSTIKNVSYIVFVGLICVCVLYLLEFILLNMIYSFYFHKEFLKIINLSLLINYFFGISLYLLSAGIIIEPVKRRVISNLIMSCGISLLYFEINLNINQMPSFYYNKNGFYYIFIAFIYAICSLITAFDNYKKGYIK